MKNIVKRIETHTFSSMDLFDIVTTALEGGINYWCGKAEGVVSVTGVYVGVKKSDRQHIKYISDLIAYNGRLLLHDIETDEKWELTRGKLLSGIKMYSIESNVPLTSIVSELDAESADQIIQYSLFKEIVFG